jgi:hypothetical protein
MPDLSPFCDQKPTPEERSSWSSRRSLLDACKMIAAASICFASANSPTAVYDGHLHPRFDDALAPVSERTRYRPHAEHAANITPKTLGHRSDLTSLTEI